VHFARHAGLSFFILNNVMFTMIMICFFGK
jgi:hypothetical protein